MEVEMPTRRAPPVPYLVLATIVLLSILGQTSLATHAAAEPSEPSLARLRASLAHASVVRLTTPFGVSIERKVEVEPAGLKITGTGEMGVVVLTPEPVMHVEWARVQRLEVKRGIGRTVLLPAAAIGAMIGGAIGYSGLDEGALGFGNVDEQPYYSKPDRVSPAGRVRPGMPATAPGIVF